MDVFGLVARLRTRALPENWHISSYAICIEAADLIEAQQREIEARTSANDWLQLEVNELRAKLEAAEKELVELTEFYAGTVADAKRYRWLRDSDKEWEHDIQPVVMVDGDMFSGVKLDAAIDAAIDIAMGEWK